MSKIELIATATFGLESVVKREIEKLGYKVIKTEDAKITYLADERGIVRSNLHLRCADRVLLKMAEFKAETSEDLFQQTKAVDWEQWIPADGKFTVNCTTVKSKLRSEPACQKTVKKAIVEKLGEVYMIDHFPETGAEYTVKVTILKDRATLTIDTSGAGLHKRGYRPAAGKAPISETLAAALIMLTPWRGDRILVDPFCGSGTFPIEAAMIAANIAPGMNRKFTAQKWTNIIDKQLWYDAVDEAEDMINLDVETDIQGFDIDADVIRKARSNAENAGVEKLIHFQERSVADLSHHKKYGFIITNPPYGERLEDKETLPGIYSAFGRQFAKLDSWSAYMITSYEDAVKYFGRKPDKNRKIYNGMLKTYFYSFQGPKPPKKEKGQER